MMPPLQLAETVPVVPNSVGFSTDRERLLEQLISAEIMVEQALANALAVAHGDQAAVAEARAAVTQVRGAFVALSGAAPGLPVPASLAAVVRTAVTTAITAAASADRAAATARVHHAILDAPINTAAQRRLEERGRILSEINADGDDYAAQVWRLALNLAGGDEELAAEIATTLTTPEGRDAVAAAADIRRRNPHAAAQADRDAAQNEAALIAIRDNPDMPEETRRMARTLIQRRIFSSQGVRPLIESIADGQPVTDDERRQFRSLTRQRDAIVAAAPAGATPRAADVWADFMDNTAAAIINDFLEHPGNYQGQQLRDIRTLGNPNATPEEKAAATVRLVRTTGEGQRALAAHGLADDIQTEEGLAAAQAGAREAVRIGTALSAALEYLAARGLEMRRDEGDRDGSLFSVEEWDDRIRRWNGETVVMREFRDAAPELNRDSGFREVLASLGFPSGMNETQILQTLVQYGILRAQRAGETNEEYSRYCLETLNTDTNNDLSGGRIQLGLVEVGNALARAARVKEVRENLAAATQGTNLGSLLGNRDGILTQQEALDALRSNGVQYDDIDTAGELRAQLTQIASRQPAGPATNR